MPRISDADICWDIVEQDYRANKKSLNQIAKEHNIGRERIKRRADKEGWERNLSDKINDAVKAKLNQSLVNAVENLPEAKTPEDRERQIVEVVAQTQVEVVNQHRVQISDLHRITRLMSSKLETQLKEGVTIEMPGEMPEDPPKIVKTDMDLEVAAKVFNNVTNGLQRLITLERQAYGMDKEEETGGRNPEMQTALDMILGAQREGLPSEYAEA